MRVDLGNSLTPSNVITLIGVPKGRERKEGREFI